MASKLYYEDVEVGTEIPSLVKHPSPRQLVMWAGASGDFNEIHYDKDFALSQGQPDVIAHGPLSAAFLAQLMTDWIGDDGTLRKLYTNNRSVVFPRQVYTCKGKVTRKYVEGSDNYVQCDVWEENSKGEKCVTAMALVTLPSRKAGS
jgi:hydroxyacyl-ACP dehydratase HTD2-like protein with hotdog domain